MAVVAVGDGVEEGERVRPQAEQGRRARRAGTFFPLLPRRYMVRSK